MLQATTFSNARIGCAEMPFTRLQRTTVLLVLKQTGAT